MKAFVLACLLGFSLTGIAHEGAHGPAQKMAPKGGTLRETTNLFLELLKEEKDVKIFAYTHESLDGDRKPLPSSEIKVVTKKSSLLDGRNKKPVTFTLEPQADHFILKFKEPSGSYRYDVKLVVTYKGKEEKPVSWQVEP